MQEETFSQTAIEKPKKDWLKIIVFSLVGLLLLFGAFYAGCLYTIRQATVKFPFQEIPTPTSVPSSILTPTPGPTVDWKTYRNEKYAFELEYPKDWEFTEYTRSTSYFSVRFVYEDKTQPKVFSFPGSDGSYANYRIDLVVQDKPFDYSLEEFCMKGAGPREELEEVTIAGKSGIKYMAVANTSGPAPVVAVEHDGRFFQVGYMVLAHSETHMKFINVFDYMLSTFKFLD